MWKTSISPIKNGFKWTYIAYFNNECKKQPQSFYFFPNHDYRFHEIEADMNRFMIGKNDIVSTISIHPTTFSKAPLPTNREEVAIQLYSCLYHMKDDAVYMPTSVFIPLQPMNRYRFYSYSVLVVLLVLTFIYISNFNDKNYKIIAFVVAFLLFYYIITSMFYNRIL